MRNTFQLAAAVLLFAAAPVGAQEPQVPADTTLPAPADTVAPALPAPDVPPAPAPADTTPADTTTAAPSEAPDQPPAIADTTEPGVVAHDWEFSLNPGERATGASGIVRVTNGEPDNRFVVEVSGLPPVDSLDQEGRDVATYTVWVVPSKERVRESTLAGTLTVDPSGVGRFDGTTALDTFGIAILATAEGATTPVGVPALTGIPVTQGEAPADTSAAETPAPEAPGEEAPEVQEAPAPDVPAPETPDAPAPETPDAPAPETPEAPPPAPADTLPPDATPQQETTPDAYPGA